MECGIRIPLYVVITRLLNEVLNHISLLLSVSFLLKLFQRGLSTVDSGNALRETARSAVNQKDMCVAVSLDIRNAFNSIGWDHVMQALIHWVIPPYLRNLLRSYFNDHVAVATCPAATEGKLLVAMSCGIPQGSVVGPLL